MLLALPKQNEKIQINRKFIRSTQNNNWGEGEYLAREAQQQAGQQDVSQEGNKLVMRESIHGREYIGFSKRFQAHSWAGVVSCADLAFLCLKNATIHVT